MRRALLLLIGTTLLAASTGCGICDEMFGFHRPWGGGDCGCNNGCGCGGGACANGACGNGACANGACGNGGCENGACGNGACGDPNGYGDGGNGYANNGGHGQLPRGVGGTYVGPQGPPTGAVAYPYYTTRGPRDFLVNNPPSIGN